MRRSQLLLGALFATLSAPPPARADIIGVKQGPAQTPPQGAPVDLGLPSGEALIDEAIALYRQKNLDGCLAKLEEAAKARPALGPARLMLAKLLLLDNQAAAGRATLDRAAVEAPDHPDVWMTLAKLDAAEGRLAEAAALYDRALDRLEAASLEPERKRASRIEAASGLAEVAQRRGDWPAAEAAARAWLAQDAGSVEARRRLGQALFFGGDREKALDEMKRAEALDPKGIPALAMMAQFCTDANDQDAAASYLEKAVAASPDSQLVQRFYAGWLLDRGLVKEAQARAEAAAKLAPDDPDVRLVLAMLALRRGDYAGAETILQALHLQNPSSLLVNDRWARSLAGQDDEAKKLRGLQVAEMNLRLNPNLPLALATRGFVARRLGRLDEAERLLRAAVASGQASSDIAYELAKVLADRRADHPDIPTLLRAGLDARGPFSYRDEARAWLDSLARAEAPAAKPAGRPPAATPAPGAGRGTEAKKAAKPAGRP